MKTQIQKLRNCFIVSFLFLSLFGFNNNANAICNGCGGGGNSPCYHVGDVIDQGCWYIGTNQLACATETYLGNNTWKWRCTINGVLDNEEIFSMSGGSCFGEISAYNPVNSPFLSFSLDQNPTLDSSLLSVPISLSRIEVWNLVDSGQVVFSRIDSLTANKTASIPNSVFANGGRYVIIGFTIGSNNADAFVSITKSQGNITVLKSFNSWGIRSSVDQQRKCVTYVNTDSVLIYIQRLNKTGRIVKGTHTANLNPYAKLKLTVVTEGILYAASINTTRSNIKDKSAICLRSSTAPYSIVDIDTVDIDSITLTGKCFFSAAPPGSYYVAVQNRNGLETWSANPVLITGDSASYDFTTAFSKAYGNNMVLKLGKWCTYSGDIDQDGYIDLSDVSAVFNDASAFTTGYSITDLTGDGQVDLADLVLVFNNAGSFVSLKSPLDP